MEIAVLMPFSTSLSNFEDSFQSVLLQTYPHIHIRIGVYGHALNSHQYRLATAMAKRHDGVFIQHFGVPLCTPNKKAYVLNRLVETVDASLVAILDEGSMWLPSKLKDQVAAMQNGKYDVVGTLNRYISNDVFQGLAPKLSTESLHVHNFLLANPIINSSALLLTRHAYWNTSCTNVEDYDLWLRLWRQGCKFFNIPKVLTLTRTFGHVSQKDSACFTAIKETKTRSSVTVVTAYYPVNGKHSTDFYTTRIKHFLTSIPCHLFIITPSAWAPFMHECRKEFKDRTVIEIREFEELHSARNMQFWNDQLELDPEREIHKDPRLYAVWAEKHHFVQLAIGLNVFHSEYFVWCDIGSFRNEANTPHLRSFPSFKRISTFDKTKMYISQMGHPKENLDEFVNLRETRPIALAGGFICGYKSLWKSYAKRIDGMFQAMASLGTFAGKEQDIMYADVLLHPHRYVLVQPKPYFGGEWFYMQYFLSDAFEE